MISSSIPLALPPTSNRKEIDLLKQDRHSTKSAVIFSNQLPTAISISVKLWQCWKVVGSLLLGDGNGYKRPDTRCDWHTELEARGLEGD